MAIRKIDQIIKLIDHPLEDHLDIESKSTELVTTKRNTQLDEYVPYDHKDKEIENDYQMIMDNAMDMVDRLKEHIDGGAEAKFLARLAEVAGQQLNIALSAVEKKAKLKDNKDKFNFRKETTKNAKSSTTINNTIIMDRNEMLRTILDSQSDQSDSIIDVESIEIDKGKINE